MKADKEKIKELYNKGFTHREIAEKLGTTRDNITKHIKAMRDKGELQERSQSEVKRKSITPYATSEYDDSIIQLYESGMIYTDIATKLNLSASYISKRARKLMEEGKIIKRAYKRTSTPKVEKREKKCDYKVGEVRLVGVSTCKKCIYGTKFNTEYGVCRFCSCTGHARITLLPPDKHGRHKGKVYCNVFEEVTKDNPRRKCLEDTIGGTINGRKG